MPSGAPSAAFAAEPTLPVPSAWPFPDRFPRTSGTSRLVGGAFEYSDFLYDDRGAKQAEQAWWSIPQDNPETWLAPAAGSYTYSKAAARGNGADIFRVGIALDDEASYWRIDWNTLADPAVPVAAFVMDSDDNPATGSSVWPGGAEVSSPGHEHTLLVSSRGAFLDASRFDVTVDGRSFVVRIPRAALPVSGSWRVRVGSGEADTAGNFTRGRVFNLGFRRPEQEPTSFNFWMESAQATAISRGDGTPFSALVDWDALSAGESSPEPIVKGWSNRWYVSSISPGEGISPEPYGVGDVKPNFLGRVQPYGVYVPESYDAQKAAPLTWVLHSLGVNHNQYSATAPRFLQLACEDRGSICATTLGRGADGWYLDEGELDFWEVWRELASSFRLHSDRTVLSGYSMGGYGTYRLGLTYPDVFAKGLAVAAPMMCGVRISGPVAGSPDQTGRCGRSGDTGPLVGNARWVPYYVGHGSNDELVPVTSVKEHVDRFDAAGYRYRFELFPGEDHMVWGLQNGFSSVAAAIGTPVREAAPGRISYAFYPHLVRDDLGIGPSGAYWVRDLRARTTTAGTLARVEASSLARPFGAIRLVDSQEPVITTDTTPGVAQIQSWDVGVTPERRPEISLTLTNIGAATVDLARAGIEPEDAVIRTASDGATTLTLRELAPNTQVLLDGAPASAKLSLPPGAHVIELRHTVPTTLSLSAPESGADTDSVAVRARLLAGETPLEGREIVLRVPGASTTAVTDADGFARATLPIDADPATAEITAGFAGGGRYLASEASAPFEVVRETSVLTFTSTNAVRGEAVRLSARLTEDDGPAIAGRTVEFLAGGRTYTAVTDSSGAASTVAVIPNHGRTQTVTARFDGAPRLEAASATTTLRWGSQG